jgi:hypothetical protein
MKKVNFPPLRERAEDAVSAMGRDPDDMLPSA